MSDDTWTLGDDMHFEAYKYHKEIDRLANNNATVWFTRELLDEFSALTEEEIRDLEEYLDATLNVDKIIQTHYGPNYIDDYMEQLDGDAETTELDEETDED